MEKVTGWEAFAFIVGAIIVVQAGRLAYAKYKREKAKKTRKLP